MNTLTLDSLDSLSDWRRPHLRCEDYIALLQRVFNGESVPFYGTDATSILSDLALARMNEESDLRRRLEHSESEGRRAREAESRTWALVLASRTRKTLRTADVRAALEGPL